MGTDADVDMAEFAFEAVSGSCGRDEKKELNGFHRYVADKLEEEGLALDELALGPGEPTDLGFTLSDIISPITAFVEAIPSLNCQKKMETNLYKVIAKDKYVTREGVSGKLNMTIWVVEMVEKSAKKISRFVNKTRGTP